MNQSLPTSLTGKLPESKSAPATVATSGGRTPEENVDSHSSVVADGNAATASHVIAGSARVERKRDEIQVRIAYRHGSRISLGSWNSLDGNGGLVVVQDPADLMALADEITAAAKALESTPQHSSQSAEKAQERT